MSNSQVSSVKPHNQKNKAKHASVKTYLQIAVILAVITAVEVAYPYATEHIVFLNPFYIPILVILSLIKFYLVVAFYMHLKYDPAILNGIFIFSLFIALALAVSMLFLYSILSI